MFFVNLFFLIALLFFYFIFYQKKQKNILENKFENVFENSGIGMAVVSLEGKFISVNKSFCNILKYNEKELLEKNFQEITYPDDLEKDLAFANKLLNKEIDTYQIEKRYLDKNNNVVWVVLTGNRVEKTSGKPDYFIAQIQDITKLKNIANEMEKFKLAVGNASDQIVITDPEGIVVYGNKAVKSTTGYSAEEAIGKKAASLWKVPMSENFYKDMWTTIKDEKKTFKSEVKNKHKEGHLYDASISISPVLDEKGEIIYFVGIERNITEEKNVDRAKTEFVSLASHQLKTPLTAINWYLEVLNEEPGKLTKKQKEYLSEISNGADKLLDIVNSLLNVSRIEMGTFSIEPKITDINAMIKDEIKEHEPKRKEKNIKIIKELEEIQKVKVDESLLRMVYQNLISNAIKYSEKNSEVLIETKVIKRGQKLKNKKAEEDFLLTKIEDSGYGIPSQDQGKVFTKMYRGENVKKLEIEGNGLGLYIVKKIVEHFGGSIWFDSKEGKGTTFYFTIPMIGVKSKKGTKRLS